MMTLFDDLRLFLLQLCRAMGLSGTASTVVPLVFLGVLLNLVALSATESLRKQPHIDHRHATLRRAALTEMKVVRTVVVSAFKKIGDGQRSLCPTQQRIKSRKTEIARFNLELGFDWATPGESKDCNVQIARSPQRLAIVLDQC
jgi:hypothetical protein